MTSPDSRLASILGEWRSQIDGGHEIDPEAVIAENPDLADELRAQFKALSKMRRAQATKHASTDLRDLPIDRYGEFKPAGQGGMGIVYWAIDTDLNREVAFKIIRPEGGEDSQAPEHPTDLATPVKDTPASQAFETLKQRFLQEAWITSGMAHPGIVPVYELGQTSEGVPYYTMRFIKGESTFATAIGAVKNKGIEERLALLEPFLKVCDALGYAHSRGVIHRDLKPENVALGEFGEAVVLDWGLARMEGQDEPGGDRLALHIQEYRDATDLKTIAGAMGTPGYMSPEAALGDSKKMDARSDVFSLGAILFEILTGRIPHEFSTFGEFAVKLLKEDPPKAVDINPAVPDTLSELCTSCLTRDMDARPASADALATAIRTWQVEREKERELEGFLREAKTALEAAENLRGAEMLQQVDRASAVVSQVLARSPASARGQAYQARLEAMREQGIAEREQSARKRTLVRTGLTALVLLVVGALVAVWLVDAARQEEARERLRADRGEQRARDQLRRTRVLALTMASAEAAKTDPMRSLLLAREAGRISMPPAVLTQLHSAIQGSLERTVLSGHEEYVASAAFSPTGDRILTASADGTARFWRRDGTELVVFRGHEGPVASAVFSPAGDRILTASQDKSARLWDLAGNELLVVHEQDFQLQSASFSPSGDRVLTVPGRSDSYDPSVAGLAKMGTTVRLWDLQGRALAALGGHEDSIASAVFSPSGDRILTASRDKTARLWDLEGKELVVLRGHEGSLNIASFSPSGDRIVTASEDHTARLWDLEGRELAVIRGHGAAVTSAVFSPSGDRVLMSSADKTARIWDLTGKELVVFREDEPFLTAAVFSPSGDRILTRNMNVVRLWDVKGTKLAELRGHTEVVISAVFSPSGDRILTAGDHAARLWDVERKELAVISGHQRMVTSVVYSPLGDRILTASFDGTARLWDLQGKELAVFRGHERYVSSAAFSPSGDRIVTAGGGGTRVWDLEGNELAVLRGHKAMVRTAAFSPSGDRIVTASHDNTARVWDLEGNELAVIEHEGGFHPSSGGPLATCVASAVFSPSGDRILTSSFDNFARVWDLAGREITVLRGHEDSVMRAVYSPSGDRILTASKDNTARLWDLEGNELVVFRGHGNTIMSAAFSPSGDRIVTASFDKTARLWDLEGNELCALQADTFVMAVTFSPSGAQIATCSDAVRIWLVNGEDLMKLADERVSREFTRKERRRYVDLLGDDSPLDR